MLILYLHQSSVDVYLGLLQHLVSFLRAKFFSYMRQVYAVLGAQGGGDEVVVLLNGIQGLAATDG